MSGWGFLVKWFKRMGWIAEEKKAYNNMITNCHFHKKRPAVVACQMCGRPLCAKCADTNFINRPICRQCCTRQFIRQRRSAGVTALAALSIVSGVFLCARVATPFPMLFVVWRAMSRELNFCGVPLNSTHAVINTAYLFVAGIFLIMAGIDLLRLREWARRGSIIFALVNLPVYVASTLLLIFWVLPVAYNTGIESVSVPSAIIGAVFCTAVAAAWSLAYLITLKRPSVRLEFGNMTRKGDPAPARQDAQA